MDLMDHLVSRTDTTCTGNKLWYVCSVGDYKGCCSSNPCTSGVCPDDDTTTSSTTKTTTTSKSSSTSSDSSTSTSSSTETVATATAETTSFSSATGSTSPSTIASATSTSTSTAAPISSSSSNHSAIIGGVIGVIAVFQIIAVILFCFWKRRQRMKNTETRIIDPGQLPSPWHMGRTGNYPVNGSTYPHFEPSVADIHDNTTISALTGGPNTSTTSLSLAGGATCAKTTPTIPTAELLASIPRRAGYTPELPGTTTRRMRAELPMDSQRDLINVPPNQRQGVMIYQRGGIAHTLPQHSQELSSTSSSPKITNNSPNSGSGPVVGLSPPSRSMTPRLMARNTARKVVTEEGVIMGANLDQYSGAPRVEDTELSIEDWNGIDNGNGNGNGNGDGDADTTKAKENSWHSQAHVMSFMNFDGSLPLTDVSEADYSHGEAEGPSPPISPPTPVSASPPISPPISNNIGTMSFMDVDPLSPTTSEVPPAYEAAEEGCEFEVNGERKTPAGTMGLGVRRFG
ncbi:hypothetical protein N7486_000768 [Penicillium sp. IBT 16267x]|nr:hypothetical protein N7486_000768 [Penicillium sp. IBT 16267x]